MSRLNRRSGFVTAALVALVAAAPLSAQQPGTAAQAPAAAPTGPVVKLSMDQAVTMGLETNLGLKSARINLDLAAQDIISAHASFLPLLRTSVTRSSQQSQSSSFTDVTSAAITSSSVAVNTNVSQTLPWYGATYSVSWNNSRSTTTRFGASFNPTLGSTLNVSYTQPLWQGFLIDSARVGVETTERRRVITDLDLQQQVLTVQTAVRDAYLGLIAANENRRVVQQNMDNTQQQLRRAQAQVAVGAAAQIDVIQAQAQVASNEVSVIGADAQVAAAQDQLRALILDPGRQDYWLVQFDASDVIQMLPKDVDVEAAVKNALANRIDLLQARENVKISDLTLRLDENLTKPAVNASVGYSASGTGGTQLTYGTGFPPPVISTTSRGYGSVLGDTFGGAYPAWQVGVNVTYPIGQTAAKATLTRAKLQREQTDINLRNLELQVVAQVRSAARNVQTDLKRVQAAQAALTASEQQLDAENRKFAVGLSDTFQVLQKQQLLAQARLTELQARIAYNQSLLDFEKVQRIR